MKLTFIRRKWSAWPTLCAGISLACSACAALPTETATHPAPPSFSGMQPASASQPVSSGSPAGAVRLGRKGSSVRPVAFQAPEIACPPGAITSCPPEARWPVAGQNPYAAGMPMMDVMLQPSPHLYPDEYLCDGGDRDWPVHYGEDTRLGLDTEDTVAEFVDHKGKEGLTKSNRVCVYSPRFAAVRSVSQPHEEGTFVEVAGMDHAGGGGEVRTRMSPTLGNRNVSLGNMAMRSRASGLESEQLASDLKQRQRPHAHDKVLNTFEDLNFFQSGLFEQSDMARLNLGIGAALVWSREQNPVIQGKVETAATGTFEVTATSLTVVEENDQPGTLRIVKVADRQTAEVGDIITFTIRYDNFGPNPVSVVRIVDNLTPRLEYVKDSATSEAAGRLVVQDNLEGSLILIWELAEPVPARSGGVVTFQTRVR